MLEGQTVMRCMLLYKSSDAGGNMAELNPNEHIRLIQAEETVAHFREYTEALLANPDDAKAYFTVQHIYNDLKRMLGDYE